MESSQKNTTRKQYKRKLRVRKKLRKSAAKPRLCVVKSAKHIYAQLIDDENARTICSVSTLSKEFKEKGKSRETAKQLGLKIAELAKEKEVQIVRFDRGSFKYHGVIASLAEGARENGLRF